MEGTRKNYKDVVEKYYYFEQRFLGLFWIPLYTRSAYYPTGPGGLGGGWGVIKDNRPYNYNSVIDALEHYSKYILDSSVKYRGKNIKMYYKQYSNFDKFRTYYIIDYDYSRETYASKTTWKYHLSLDDAKKAIDDKLYKEPKPKQVM